MKIKNPIQYIINTIKSILLFQNIHKLKQKGRRIRGKIK